jgi:hypothetical protein
VSIFSTCIALSIHNQKILVGYKKPEVKRVQFDAESDEELTEHKVRQVNTTSTSPIQNHRATHRIVVSLPEAVV